MYNVAILLFDDIEVLDFAGPFEVFSVCGQRGKAPAPFHVFTVAERSTVMARNRLSINATYTLENAPLADILVIPGGGGYDLHGKPFGSRKEMDNPLVLAWIKVQNAHASLVLSVCTGALILAKAGLLEGLSATTHWAAMEQMRTIVPATTLHENKRWVDNGRIILSAGVSAGIDMSLYVVGKLFGKATADETARYMQYDHWHDQQLAKDI